jgi:hypothetical protein
MKRRIKHELHWNWRRIKLYGIFAWFVYGLLILHLIELIVKLSL